MARSPFPPPIPSDWALVVEAGMPEEGSDSDYPTVRNRRGGFVRVSCAEGGSVSSNRSR